MDTIVLDNLELDGYEKTPCPDTIREEYRYLRYLLNNHGIFFHEINDSLVMYIRQNIILKITKGEPQIIQYIVHYRTTAETVLNTKEEYLEYLATNPPVFKRLGF